MRALLLLHDWQLHYQGVLLRLLSLHCRYFLAKHPAAMKKLEEELDAAGLLKTPQNPDPRQFTYADIGKLRYLDWCIKVSTAGALPSHITFALGKDILIDMRPSATASQCCYVMTSMALHGVLSSVPSSVLQISVGEHEAAAGGSQLPEARRREGCAAEQRRRAPGWRQHRGCAVQHVPEPRLGLEGS